MCPNDRLSTERYQKPITVTFRGSQVHDWNDWLLLRSKKQLHSFHAELNNNFISGLLQYCCCWWLWPPRTTVGSEKKYTRVILELQALINCYISKKVEWASGRELKNSKRCYNIRQLACTVLNADHKQNSYIDCYSGASAAGRRSQFGLTFVVIFGLSKAYNHATSPKDGQKVCPFYFIFAARWRQK